MRIAREGAVALRRTRRSIRAIRPRRRPDARRDRHGHGAPGQRVTKGTPIASIEAMKMETVLFADRDATVASVHVKPGDQVEARIC